MTSRRNLPYLVLRGSDFPDSWRDPLAPFAVRVLRNQELGRAESDVDVEASVGRLYWGSVVLDPALLRCLVLAVEADRISLGSDSDEICRA